MEAQLKAAKTPEDRSLGQIAKAVAEFYGIRPAQLRSLARLKRTVAARQVAMLLAREMTGESAAAIARFFGRKNHTTVVHACRRTRALLGRRSVPVARCRAAAPDTARLMLVA